MNHGPPEERLDILLPYWGDPDLFRLTVESVVDQTNDSWRLTIVDDAFPGLAASTYIESLSNPRIRYFRNDENIGIAKNFERCRQLTEYPLVVFLGCDDILHSDYVATIIDASRRYQDAAFFSPEVAVIDNDSNPSRTTVDGIKRHLRPSKPGVTTLLRGESLAVSLLRGNWLYWPSIAFRREALVDMAFRTDYKVLLDLDLIMRMVLRGDTLAALSHECFSYRRHSASLSSMETASGDRFVEERRFFAEVAAQSRDRSWHRAERASRLRLTSRLHAAALLTQRRGSKSVSRRTLIRHAFGTTK